MISVFFKTVGLSSLALALCMSVNAQTVPLDSVFEESLGAAQAYDAGVIDYGQGGLDPTLWNGTSVEIALSIIDAAPVTSKSAATLDLVANTLLSGGTPPQGGSGNEDYFAARLGKLVSMGRSEAVDQLVASQPEQAFSGAGQQIGADKALVSGNIEEACSLSDRAQDLGAEPYWVKLRAFCHVTRDEVPAAELTSDLLRSSGHDAPEFYKALLKMTGINSDEGFQAGNDALLIAMRDFANARQNEGVVFYESPSMILRRFITDAPKMSSDEFETRMLELARVDAPTEEENPGGYFDLDASIAATTPASWGQLFGIIKTGSDAGVTAKVSAELLRRAQDNGVFDTFARQLADDLAIVPPSISAQYGAELFARMAIVQGDLSNLRTLYDGIDPQSPLKSRIALASDALGNGFVLGTLGQDMTERLSGSGSEKARAVRDSFIAVGLGARLSDEAAIVLSKSSAYMTGRAANPASMLVLKAAASKGAKAETALRAAAILGEGGPSSLRADSLASILDALNEAGLQTMAGRLAAEDFMGD